jgi:hypothetical protein
VAGAPPMVSEHEFAVFGSSDAAAGTPSVCDGLVGPNPFPRFLSLFTFAHIKPIGLFNIAHLSGRRQLSNENTVILILNFANTIDYFTNASVYF